ESTRIFLQPHARACAPLLRYTDGPQPSASGCISAFGLSVSILLTRRLFEDAACFRTRKVVRMLMQPEGCGPSVLLIVVHTSAARFKMHTVSSSNHAPCEWGGLSKYEAYDRRPCTWIV